MTTEQEVLDDLIQAITNTNTSNDDFLKVLKEGRDQDVALRDGTVVPSLTKRVVNAFSNSDYLMKADNLASVVDKQEARDNLNVPTKEEVAQATETEKGTAKIATTAIAQEGTNDTDIITAKKLRDALNATGEAPISACRAWVSFNGTTSPPTIKGASNVASISKLQSGRYVINFQTPMANSDYAVLTGFASGLDATAILMVSSWGIPHGNATLKTTTQLDVSNKAIGSAATYDGKDLFIAIIG